MNTKKLHWVFYCQENDMSCYLATEDNKALSYPTIRDVTEEEKKKLTELDIEWETDKASDWVIHCFPKKSTTIEVEAPVYVGKGNIIDGFKFYKEGGRYIGEHVNPKDIHCLNESVKKVVPKWKIIRGNSVNVDDECN